MIIDGRKNYVKEFLVEAYRILRVSRFIYTVSRRKSDTLEEVSPRGATKEHACRGTTPLYLFTTFCYSPLGVPSVLGGA